MSHGLWATGITYQIYVCEWKDSRVSTRWLAGGGDGGDRGDRTGHD